jgi:hypothetical protein
MTSVEHEGDPVKMEGVAVLGLSRRGTHSLYASFDHDVGELIVEVLDGGV